MSEYDDFDEMVKNHWAMNLLDAPAALVAVIETKIVRAALGEQRRIIALIEAKGVTCGMNQPEWELSEIIALIKGENE